MNDNKVIAVVGATGSQGGGLVRAMLADPSREYAVRALTRDPRSAAAQEFAAAGAEVVAADLDDEASVRKAFDGAYGAFVVTNYWAPLSPEEEAARSRAEMELAQAGNAARAARDAGVRHVIWSTLEDTREHFGDDERVPSVENGRYKVPHFDAKGEANALFTEYGVPTTFLQTAFYFDGFTKGLGPSRNAGGQLELTLPMEDQPLSGIASEDIGRTALGIFKRGTEFIGRTISIAGDHLTGEQYAAVLSEVLGEPVVYRPWTWEQFRASGIPSAVEMANTFQFYAEDSQRFTGIRDLELVRELNPELQSFAEWAEKNKAKIAS